jgi:hypothetical protein
MQPAKAKPVLDRVSGNTGTEQLPPRNHAMLPVPEGHDHRFHPSPLGFDGYIQVNPSGLGHGAEVGTHGRSGSAQI